MAPGDSPSVASSRKGAASPESTRRGRTFSSARVYALLRAAGALSAAQAALDARQKPQPQSKKHSER